MTDGDSDRPFARAGYTPPRYITISEFCPWLGLGVSLLRLRLWQACGQRHMSRGGVGANVVHSTAVVIG